MVLRVLRLVTVLLLCIALVSYVMVGESYNEKHTLSFFLGQLANENIPDLFTPVRDWFAEARTGNEFVDTLTSIAQVLVYGNILPIQAVIYLGYFFKVWWG